METESGTRPRHVHTRTRAGCLNCRRKKRKCDEDRPACGKCRKRGETCEWGMKITFRAENASGIDGTHPSMRRNTRRHPLEFEILDVTSEVIRNYDLSPPATESDNDNGAAAETPATEESPKFAETPRAAETPRSGESPEMSPNDLPHVHLSSDTG